MQKLVLYIGSERLDLFKDETVSLTQTIQNVKDIKKIFTEFTQTFSVPASKKNNKIFKHYYNFHISNAFDARRKQDATLELNDITFKIGKIRLDGVDLKNNLAHTYKITFFGNTVDLKDILGDKQLSTLSDLAQYNQLYTYQKIKDGIENYATGTSNNILVPLITHSDRMFYNDTIGAADYTNVFYNSNFRYEDNGINWNQFKYAIRVQAIIEAIESEYTVANGYASDISFSDDFFNDATNDQFNNLFLWLHRKKGGVETPSIGGFVMSQVTDLNDIVYGGNINTYPAISENGIITIVAEEYLSWTTKLQLTPVEPLIEYSVRITRQGDGAVWIFENLTGNQPFSTFQDFTDETVNEAGTYVISIGSASVISFAAGNILLRLDIEEQEGSNTLIGNQEISNAATWQTTPDLEFNIVEQIPKMSIIDFLTGLFQMFNLTAYVDNGIIVVKTLDDYYAESTQVINIDQYLDTTKSVVDVALPFKEVNFSYKGLGTILAKQFEQINNSGWGSLSYSLNNEIYDAPSESYSIELPFEHLLYERLRNENGGAVTDIQYGYFVDDNQEPYFGSPLLFYPIRQTSSTNLSFRNTNPSGRVPITSYFIPSNSVSLNFAVSRDNIHFNRMVNEYTANNKFDNTLFKTKYQSYIEDVFNSQRRLTKVTAYLPYKIFSSLKLNDLIQLGQNNYKINSLKTNLTNGKSEFELLNTIL
jgi:hypothetical protein